eukprot:2767723-Alexandrium_andersonii.AAC.1
MRSSAAAVKRAVTPGVSKYAAQALAFSTLGPCSPDPWYHILYRRARKLRQMWHASEEVRTKVALLLA